MKKPKCLLTVLLLLISLISFSQVPAKPQLTFKNIQNLPYRLLWPATVTDGKYIYAINGYIAYGGGYSADVLKYDPKVNKWTKFNKHAGYKSKAAAAYVTADNHTYIFGGTEFRGQTIYRGVQSLDMQTGQVDNLKVSNPIAASNAAATVWNNKIYLFGGTQENRHTISSMYQFDPQTKQFTRLADMPETLETEGTIINGVLYTFGGYDEFLRRMSDNINAYDIANNTWRTIGKLPEAVFAHSVAAYNNLIFVIGGYDNETFLGYFDTTTQKFTKLKTNMEGRRAAGAAVIDNKLYIFGGTSRFYTDFGGMQSAQVADLSQLQLSYSAR